MTDALRWAARYTFCEELWRDRARIVWDRHLEVALGSGQTGVGARGPDPDDPVAAMLDALVPRQSTSRDRGARRIDVSMGVLEEAAGRRLAPRRPATQFLTLGALCDAARRRDWSVALVDLSDLLVSDGPDAPARLSVRGTELLEALASRLAEGGRTAVVSVTAAADAATAGIDYGGLLALLGPLLAAGGSLRIYGVLCPPMAAIVELRTDQDADEQDEDDEDEDDQDDQDADDQDADDPRREGEEQTADVLPRPLAFKTRPGRGGARRGSGAWREGDRTFERAPDDDDEEDDEEDQDVDETEQDERDDDVPLAFDNTLGSQQPALVEYIAVVGELAAGFAPEGMTLVELPSAAAAGPSDASPAGAAVALDASGPLRAQLAEARRQADLSAIERQGLVERLDDLESDNVALRAEATEMRDRLARALAEAPGPASTAALAAELDASARLDTAHAELQALRWTLTQTQRSLDAARARPVEALEADVARLSALLAARPPADPDPVAPAAPVVQAGVASVGPRVPSSPCRAARPVATEALRADLDSLLHRIERADISALELRKRLLALRQGLVRRLADSR